MQNLYIKSLHISGDKIRERYTKIRLAYATAKTVSLAYT